MNVRDLSSFPKDQFFSFLDSLIRNMPGFVALKSIDSTYISASLLCAKYAGYETIDGFVGKKDNEWRCDVAELAKEFQAQDKLITETKKVWSSFNAIKFSTGWTYYFSNKSLVYAPTGEMVGILFIGTVLTDFQLMKALSLLVKEDVKRSEVNCKSVVYTFPEEKDKPFFTQREEECLFYLMRGKSAKETAKLLKISFRTVEVHIEQIKYKFNCHTKSEIFSKAIAAGYLYRIPLSLLKSTELS